MTKEPPFQHPYLLLCEGTDDRNFFSWFLQCLTASTGDSRYKNFDVRSFGGNKKLGQHLKGLPTHPGFSIVKSMMIICDAENDAEGTNQSIRDSLKRYNFAIPNSLCEIASPNNGQHQVDVSYALLPVFNSTDRNGALEDLCLNILSDTDKNVLLSIVEEALGHVKGQVGELSRIHKNKLHTYLSLTNEYVGLKVGESANKKAFDFSAKELEPLKELLRKICNAEGVSK